MTNTCKTIDSSRGLILVYSDHGSKVPVEEFNDWYDNEHMQPRLAVPGILSISRYKAADSQVPSWLALYDVTSPDVAQSAQYKALKANASEREKNLMSKLDPVNRLVYSPVLSCIHPDTTSSALPGKFVLVVHLRVTLEGEDEFNKWYNEEHMELLSKIPGWLRGRRYKLVESSLDAKRELAEDEEPYVDYFAIHDMGRNDFFDLPEFQQAQTPWRERIMTKFIKKREMRVFEQYKVFKRDESAL